MKKIRQEEKQEQNSPGSVKPEASSVVLSSKSFFASSEIPIFISIIPYPAANNSGKPIARTISIFHPPSA